MKIQFISLEGCYKKGVEKELESVVSSIKNDFNGDVDAWWENAYLDEEMDLISDNGNFGENLEFFIEEGGKHFDVHEYLKGQL